jgi:hypothetical protein
MSGQCAKNYLSRQTSIAAAAFPVSASADCGHACLGTGFPRSAAKARTLPMNRPNSREASRPPGSRANAPEAWQATRSETVLATQFLGDREDYLAPGLHEIGRQISATERELFVSCAPDLALQQQFEHGRSEFIAVHDIGTHSSRKLLAGLAAATGRVVQKLVVRRQGYGTALAVVEFIELPNAEGAVLRMYSTEVDADTAVRLGLARTLLAFSRLGVILVGDLPGHAIASALRPIREAIITEAWPNRRLLLLPLVSGSTLSTQGAELASGTRVDVVTTPVVARPSDAWDFIQGSWGRTSEPVGREATPRRPPEPLAMRPMPVVSRAERQSAAPSALQHYVEQVKALNGVLSCCVFEVASGRDVAHAGPWPAATELALHGKALLSALIASSRNLGLGPALPEAAITLGSHHLLLRAVPGHPTLAMHAALDKTSANLTLARLQVQRLDALLGD